MDPHVSPSPSARDTSPARSCSAAVLAAANAADRSGSLARLLQLTPLLSLGEGSGSLRSEAPDQMTIEQLGFQAIQLEGRQSVLTFIPPGATACAPYACKILRAAAGHMVARFSPADSHVDDTVPWSGPPLEVDLSALQGGSVRRLVAATVHQKEVIERLKRSISAHSTSPSGGAFDAGALATALTATKTLPELARQHGWDDRTVRRTMLGYGTPLTPTEAATLMLSSKLKQEQIDHLALLQGIAKALAAGDRSAAEYLLNEGIREFFLLASDGDAGKNVSANTRTRALDMHHAHGVITESMLRTGSPNVEYIRTRLSSSNPQPPGCPKPIVSSYEDPRNGQLVGCEPLCGAAGVDGHCSARAATVALARTMQQAKTLRHAAGLLYDGLLADAQARLLTLLPGDAPTSNACARELVTKLLPLIGDHHAFVRIQTQMEPEGKLLTQDQIKQVLDGADGALFYAPISPTGDAAHWTGATKNIKGDWLWGDEALQPGLPPSTFHLAGIVHSRRDAAAMQERIKSIQAGEGKPKPKKGHPTPRGQTQNEQTKGRKPTTKTSTNPAAPHFQLGRQAPAPTEKAGGKTYKEILLGLQERDPDTLPGIIDKGLTAGVRRQHRRMIKRATALPEKFHNMPWPEALAAWMEEESEKHQWAKSTLLRNMGTCMGLISRLEQYCKVEQAPEPLSSSQAWKDALKTAKQSANADAKVPPGLLPSQYLQAFNDTYRADPRTAALLVAAWATAARVSDLMSVRRGEMTLEGSKLSITFKRGKTAKLAEPHTVHTEISDPTQLQCLTALHKEGRDWIWDAAVEGKAITYKKLMTTLRATAGQDITQSSIRRGALQHMAQMGATEEQLMHFSGHRNVHTLRRYLGWNLHAAGKPKLQAIGKAHTAQTSSATPVSSAQVNTTSTDTPPPSAKKGSKTSPYTKNSSKPSA